MSYKTPGPRLSIIPAAAVCDPNLEPRDIQVLCLFGRHTDEAGWCRRSQVKMARELRCARSTVQLAIKRLVAAGWLIQRALKIPGEPGSRDTAHEYRVMLDVPDIAPADRSAPPADRSAPPADPVSAPMLTTPLNEGISSQERAPVDELREVIDADRANALARHFDEIGKPLSIHTAKVLARKLNAHPDPNDAADEMLLHRWTSFNADWLTVKGKRKMVPKTSTSAEDRPKAGEDGARANSAHTTDEKVPVSSIQEPDLFKACERLRGKSAPQSKTGVWHFDAAIVARARREVLA